MRSAPPRLAALVRWLRLLVLVAPAAFAAAPAIASTEEFSTFDVERIEEDDESLIDHWLTRTPRDWNTEWERSPRALRTAQGCLTSGQWFIETDLKLSTALGKKARFAIEYDESQSDLVTYQFLDLLFLYPQPAGALGFRFRPLYDKSRQDFAVFWESAPESSAFFVRATFGLEDLFNNLWAWRQTRVGNTSEPYDRHPWEPALDVGARGKSWRASLNAKWLTPSVQRTATGYTYVPIPSRRKLWGAVGRANLEATIAGTTFEATGENWQAQSSDEPLPPEAGVVLSPADSAIYFGGDDGRYRRLWSAGFSARREIARRWSAEIGGLYQARRERWRPPTGPGAFDAVDRLIHAELVWRAHPRLTARFGGLFDRITLARSGSASYGPHPIRNETRGYLGLAARFGNVSVFGVEGLEFDSEPYDVWLVHDKGFLGLQATF